MTKKSAVLFAVSLLVCAAIGVELAIAFTAATGFAATNFATGFLTTPFDSSSLGPIGLAFDASGNLFVGDPVNGFLYKFGPAGGVASTATQLNTTPITGAIVGLAFTKDGRLYLARRDAGDVLEINASNGAVIRTVVASIVRATGLATDPLSGDLFVSQTVFDGQILRISNFASGTGTVTPYAATPADGIAFGPDGTLYAAVFGLVAKIAGTNAPTPGAVTFINTTVPTIDGMAVSANPNTPFLYGNRNDGIITKIDLTTNPPTLTNIFANGTRGDFAVVGFDGCLYATQSDSIVKVTNADGTCVPPPLGPLLPTSPTAVHVAVDIKPQSCPNPLNVGGAGVLPVAILGTASFDVTTVDLSSVKLQDVPALRSALEDEAAPFTRTLMNATDCTTAGPDGFTDLLLSFDNQAVSAALGPVTDGQVLILTLTGKLLPQFGGTAIRGQDVVIIRKK